MKDIIINEIQNLFPNGKVKFGYGWDLQDFVNRKNSSDKDVFLSYDSLIPNEQNQSALSWEHGFLLMIMRRDDMTEVVESLQDYFKSERVVNSDNKNYYIFTQGGKFINFNGTDLFQMDIRVLC